MGNASPQAAIFVSGQFSQSVTILWMMVLVAKIVAGGPTLPTETGNYCCEQSQSREAFFSFIAKFQFFLIF